MDRNIGKGTFGIWPVFAKAVILLLVSLPLTPTAWSQEKAAEPADPRANYPNEFSAVSVRSYTREFAERFGLPAPQGEAPKDGILAIEFRVHQHWGHECVLNVYLDNKLNLAYPEGEIGFIYREKQLLQNLGDWKRLEDRKYTLSYDHKYNGKTVLSSADYVHRKSGFADDLSIRHYRKHFLPDVAYVSLWLPCSFPAKIVSRRSPMLLWLEKQGGKDYTKQLRYEPGDFYRFRIPLDFFERLAPHAAKAYAKDSAVLEKEYALRREKLQRQLKK